MNYRFNTDLGGGPRDFMTQPMAGGLNFGGSGPAPAANASPVVPTVPIPNPGGVVDVQPQTPVIDPVNPAGGGGNWFSKSFFNQPDEAGNGGGGLNMDFLKGSADILGAFGSLYAGYQTNKIAKKSLAFQESAYKTNLANQLSSYNLALEDRANARFAQNNRSQDEADGYINKHRLG